VISIKKYLDLDANALNKFRPPSSDELKDALLRAYKSVLGAMGDCGAQVCPTTGANLQKHLAHSAEILLKSATPALIQQNENAVDQHLQDWGRQTVEYFQERAGDVKEIVMTLARVAESVTERDQRYTNQFNEFTQRLQALANLEDLPQIRAAIVRGAKDLKTCVDRMEQDSRESVAALRTQVATYQTKLEAAEQKVSQDALTGLENRHGLETQLQNRINAEKPFCLMLLDLNGFKPVNDTYGHEAGDDLLKQFSGELRAASRATDTVGRWGGDEFIVLLDCSLEAAESHLERLKKWVFGGYTLRLSAGSVKVEVAAAVGLVEWSQGETGKQVLARADARMYKEKGQTGQAAGARPSSPAAH
jgi:diguanylate cyclase (GGDEF)-like protein